jgi:phosphoribosylglycinamide formyltransferase-1
MARQKIKLAVFISGRGSNAQALIDACENPDFPAEIVLLLSNRPDALGLARAEKAGIATEIVDHKAFADKASFEAALQAALTAYDVDLICLAGFMRLLSGDFLAHWPQKVINIHPSLLPDYKGLNTHERALADKRTQSGCTVHYVVAEMDAGEIIVQKAVPIIGGDTPTTLAARILEQEHIAYPEAVQMIAQNILREQ